MFSNQDSVHQGMLTLVNSTRLPTDRWIRCVAPEKSHVIRITTIVSDVSNTGIRKSIDVIVVMGMWCLRIPTLTRKSCHSQTPSACVIMVISCVIATVEWDYWKWALNYVQVTKRMWIPVTTDAIQYLLLNVDSLSFYHTYICQVFIDIHSV